MNHPLRPLCLVLFSLALSACSGSLEQDDSDLARSPDASNLPDVSQDVDASMTPIDLPDAGGIGAEDMAAPGELDLGDSQGEMHQMNPERDRLATVIDPDFSVQNIQDPVTRRYYKTLLERIDGDNDVTSCAGIQEEPGYADKHTSWNQAACSNNTYIQGRMLQVHIGELLDVFRLTGDKRLLDEVDRLMELTRSTIGTFRGSQDYAQWKPIRVTSQLDDLSNWPKQFLNEILAHALVARVAAALKDNAHVPDTPYGEHARQWTEYLKGEGGYEEKIKHYFAPEFPFIAGAPFGLGQEASSTWNRKFGSANLAHIYMYHVLYLHYMGRLTEDPAYAQGSMEMMNHWSRLKVDPRGDAYVWPHSTILPDASPKDTGKLGFAPVGYSSMTLRAAVDLALDGHPFFDDELTMSRFSRTVSYHILDQRQFDQGNQVNPYRRSVGHNQPQWIKGERCSQSEPVLIRATRGDKCVDIDGVRFFNLSRDANVALSTGAFTMVGVWPTKATLEELEESKIYAFHAAAYDPKEALFKGVKSLIFARLWVEGGHGL